MLVEFHLQPINFGRIYSAVGSNPTARDSIIPFVIWKINTDCIRTGKYVNGKKLQETDRKRYADESKVLFDGMIKRYHHVMFANIFVL